MQIHSINPTSAGSGIVHQALKAGAARIAREYQDQARAEAVAEADRVEAQNKVEAVNTHDSASEVAPSRELERPSSDATRGGRLLDELA